MKDHSSNRKFFISGIKLSVLVFTLSIFIIAGCGGSAEELDTTKNEPSIITLNVLAQYSLEDTTYTALGDMIDRLNIIDKLTSERRERRKGEVNKQYEQTIKFVADNGEYFIELIDIEGNRRDTTITIPIPGEYTLEIPIILDEVSPVDIDRVIRKLGIGKVTIDK